MRPLETHVGSYFASARQRRTRALLKVIIFGDTNDANTLLKELCIEPEIEILAAPALTHNPDSILRELGKHADTTNIFIGFGNTGAQIVAHIGA